MTDKADIHRQINAHLLAAGRNPLKRAQHLLAATRYCDDNGIPHFGRYTEQSIDSRAARRAQYNTLHKGN
jgi:hypothetical protein